LTLLRKPGAAFATLLFLLLGAAFLTQVVPYRQIIDSKRQVDSARSQLATLESDNTSLQADVDALGTDEEIEKLAREKLGYVRPGETSFVVVVPPESGQQRPAPPPESAVEPETWVDQIWSFISGGDLASDG
jgi:cell division protein FtsB